MRKILKCAARETVVCHEVELEDGEIEGYGLVAHIKFNNSVWTNVQS